MRRCGAGPNPDPAPRAVKAGGVHASGVGVGAELAAALGVNDHAARAFQGKGVGRASTASEDGGPSASGSDTGATSGRATPPNLSDCRPTPHVR